jgi:hypothetical protein
MVNVTLVTKNAAPNKVVVRVIKFAAERPDIMEDGPPPMPKAPPPSDRCSKMAPMSAKQISRWRMRTAWMNMERA